jgi:3-(3-hydroxy-phenyl)propionate hydroxylase
VVYCGDAAHLLPVFGVRGLNTGIQDSFNLGWKLASVLAGRARPEILDTYSSERVADARQICVDAGRSTRMVAPPTRGFRIMQEAVLSLCLDHEFPRGLLHWRTSHPIDYNDSPLTCIDPTESRFDAGPRPGAPARNVRLQPERASFVLDVFKPGSFLVLVFGSDQAAWAAASQDVLRARTGGLPVQLVAVRSDAAPADGADATLHDPEGHAQSLWGAQGGAVYVLRPDQHVCARWKAGSPTRVSDVLQRALGLPGQPWSNKEA